MSEVEAVCGRVIIIARGQIALDDALDRIQAESSIVVEARGPADGIKRTLESIPSVEKVVSSGEEGPHAAFVIHTRDGIDLREEISQRLIQNGWPLRQLDVRRTTLEDRFIDAVNKDTLAAAAEREAV
jgi:ABC-2 type transport system ATP-binding protein